MDQLVIRAATLDDLDQLLELSKLVGSGMTTMPTDRQIWTEKLERSNNDFKRATASGGSDTYFLVMEDIDQQEIVGSCAIYTGIGLERPFYSYKLATHTSSSEKLDLTVHTRTLSLVNDFVGTTEIGSLFLRKEYRRDGIGKFLSRSRFLLLADFPDRFNERIFAEMLGWLNEHAESPFWESLGKKFFGLSFQRADFISAVDGFQFISDLMPKYPVYVDLLSEQAQEVIGKPHDDTVGALRILEKEGFAYSGYVDIFDAGPTISTRLQNIRSVIESKPATVTRIEPDLDERSEGAYLISNSRLPDYRLTRARLIEVNPEHNSDSPVEVKISQSTANALAVEPGDPLRILNANNKAH